MTLDPAYSLLSEDPTVIRAAGASPDDYPSVLLDGPLGPCAVAFYSPDSVLVSFLDGREPEKDPTKNGWQVNRVAYRGRVWLRAEGLAWKENHVSVYRVGEFPGRDNEPTRAARERILDCAMGAVRFADKLRPMLSLRAAASSTSRALATAHERLVEAKKEASAAGDAWEEARNAHARAVDALACAEVDANRAKAGLIGRTV